MLRKLGRGTGKVALVATIGLLGSSLASESSALVIQKWGLGNGTGFPVNDVGIKTNQAILNARFDVPGGQWAITGGAGNIIKFGPSAPNLAAGAIGQFTWSSPTVAKILQGAGNTYWTINGTPQPQPPNVFPINFKVEHLGGNQFDIQLENTANSSIAYVNLAMEVDISDSFYNVNDAFNQTGTLFGLDVASSGTLAPLSTVTIASNVTVSAGTFFAALGDFETSSGLMDFAPMNLAFVPEASSGLLLGLGLVAVSMYRRRLPG